MLIRPILTFLEADAGGGSAPAPAVTAPAIPVAAPESGESTSTRSSIAPHEAFTGVKPVAEETQEVVAETRKKLGFPEVKPKATKPATKPAPKKVAPKPVEAAKEPESVTPTPATPTKVKVGDEEYTPEELAALVARAKTPPAPRAPEQPPTPQAQQTPEELAAETAQREAEYVERESENAPIPDVPEDELDVILGGGPDAVKKFNELRKKDFAHAQMAVVKKLAAQLNPVLEKFEAAITPLLQREQQIIEHEVRSDFSTRHAHLVPHADRAEWVARELATKYPAQVNRMTRQQFTDEVARQTEVILNQQAAALGFPDWRSARPAPAPAPTVAAPAAAVPVPSIPRGRPPAGVSPAGAGSGATPVPWQKAQVARLEARLR